MPPTPAEQAAIDAFLPKIAGSHVHPKSMLATDYLNHFNEVVMLIEMVPDMPDVFPDCKAWQPKSYKQHFRDSTIADKEVAIAAYDLVPADVKKQFEEAIVQASFLVIQTNMRLEKALEQGASADELRMITQPAVAGINRFLQSADGIIHGSERTMSQEEIDDVYNSLGINA